MTREQMIEKVEQMHRSKIGYQFDPAKVVEAIDSGIPTGAILAVAGSQTVKYEGAAAVVYVDGIETRRTPLVGDAMDKAVMTYAYGYSKQGSQSGSM